MKETMLEQVKDSYIKAELGQILRLHTLKRDTILSIDKSLDHFLGRLPHWQKDALLFLLSKNISQKWYLPLVRKQELEFSQCQY